MSKTSKPPTTSAAKADDSTKDSGPAGQGRGQIGRERDRSTEPAAPAAVCPRPASPRRSQRLRHRGHRARVALAYAATPAWFRSGTSRRTAGVPTRGAAEQGQGCSPQAGAIFIARGRGRTGGPPTVTVRCGQGEGARGPSGGRAQPAASVGSGVARRANRAWLRLRPDRAALRQALGRMPRASPCIARFAAPSTLRNSSGSRVHRTRTPNPEPV